MMQQICERIGQTADLNRYLKKEKLGEGTYGKVYKGEDRETGETVALKRVCFNDSVTTSEGVPSTTLREVAILRSLRHPNIVRLRDVLYIDSSSEVYMVFEYLDTDLKMFIEKRDRRDALTNRKLAKSYLYQLLLAVNYCHVNRVLHRDLKPANILIDTAGNLKLADFGLGRTYSIPMMKYTHEVVTLYYRAPEILLGSEFYSLSVDIWSIGCIFAEMISGNPLFKAESEIDLLYRIFRTLGTPVEESWPGVTQLRDYQNHFPKWPSQKLDKFVRDLEPEGVKILSKMLRLCPNKRISAHEALSDSYFLGGALSLQSSLSAGKDTNTDTDAAAASARQRKKRKRSEDEAPAARDESRGRLASGRA